MAASQYFSWKKGDVLIIDNIANGSWPNAVRILEEIGRRILERRKT